MDAVTTEVSVILPGVLRARVGGARSVRVAGATVAQLIGALEERYPGLGFNLCYETGELRPFVNVFVNGVNIRYLHGLETPVPADAQVYILPSVAGG